MVQSSISLQITRHPDSYVLPTYVYFLNDNSNLYILVDAVGDHTDSGEMNVFYGSISSTP